MQEYTGSKTETALETLIDKPLSSIAQNKGELILGFGDTHHLQIGTQFRFALRWDIILGKKDIFLPSFDESTKPGFDFGKFDWEKEDSTRYHQQIDRFFNENILPDYNVRKVEAGDFGDFTLIFANAVRLEVKGDAYGGSNTDGAYELWRLSDGSEHPFVVTSLGIADPKELSTQELEVETDG